MSLHRSAWVVALALALNGVSRADDPLRLVPSEADLVLKIEQPRRLVESITTRDVVKNLDQFAPFREVMDSTTVKRFFQLLRYYEKELGADWPAMIDKLAGGGIVVGVDYGTYAEAPKAGVIVRGTDADAVGKFFGLAVQLLEQEYAKEGAPFELKRKTHRGAEVVKFPGELLVAHAGDTIILASAPAAMERILAQREGEGKSIADNPGVSAAKKLLAPDPLAWLWYDFEPVKQRPELKAAFEQPRNDVIQTLFFGGLLDVMKRSSFVSAGAYASDGGLKLALRLPAGTPGRAADTNIHLPPDGTSGTLPLLEPKGVVFSQSFYFDFGELWDNRDKIFPKATADGFTELDTTASKFLPGTSIPKLFRGAGPHHRLVMVAPRPTVYQTQPAQKSPGFAVVTSMRDPDFGKSMELFIRGGVLAAGGYLKLKLKTFEHHGVRVVGYQFPDGVPLEGDEEGVRYNFTPCFARLDGQFLACSTFELAREMIDTLKKEGTVPPPSSSSNMRMRVYAEGGATLLNATPDQLLTQAILDQAIPIGEAEKQVQQFVAYLKALGSLSFEHDYRKDYFEFAIEWKQK